MGAEEGQDVEAAEEGEEKIRQRDALGLEDLPKSREAGPKRMKFLGFLKRRHHVGHHGGCNFLKRMFSSKCRHGGGSHGGSSMSHNLPEEEEAAVTEEEELDDEG